MSKLQLHLVLHSMRLPEEIGNRKLGQEKKVTDFVSMRVTGFQVQQISIVCFGVEKGEKRGRKNSLTVQYC